MEALQPKKDSLYGRATFIRNQLRGGIATDDDSYPLSMLMASIVSVSAELINAELAQRVSVGKDFDLDLLVNDTLRLTVDAVDSDYPVVYLYSTRPRTGQWFGNAAVKSLKPRKSPTEWAWAYSELDAISKAIGYQYYPARPAYWNDGDKIRLVLPITMGLVREVDILYIPEKLDTFVDGSARDIYEDPFPLPERLWETVWTTVFSRVGANLIRTTPNRDEVNNGTDIATAKPVATR